MTAPRLAPRRSHRRTYDSTSHRRGHLCGETSASWRGRSRSWWSPWSSPSCGSSTGTYLDNAEAKNLQTGFDFLDQPAGFPIPSSDFRTSQPMQDAIVEGLKNTLRLAVTGIILSTVLGTLIGVARLSQNFILRSAAKAYVEIIRNVPLLALVTLAVRCDRAQRLPAAERVVDAGADRRAQRPRVERVLVRGSELEVRHRRRADAAGDVGGGPLAPCGRRSHGPARPHRSVGDPGGARRAGRGVGRARPRRHGTGARRTAGHRRDHDDACLLRRPPRARRVHLEPHRRDRPRVDPGGAPRAGRGGRRAGALRLPAAVVRRAPPGDAHRGAADREPVPQPDQELVAGGGDQLPRADEGDPARRGDPRPGGPGLHAAAAHLPRPVAADLPGRQPRQPPVWRSWSADSWRPSPPRRWRYRRRSPSVRRLPGPATGSVATCSARPATRVVTVVSAAVVLYAVYRAVRYVVVHRAVGDHPRQPQAVHGRPLPERRAVADLRRHRPHRLLHRTGRRLRVAPADRHRPRRAQHRAVVEAGAGDARATVAADLRRRPPAVAHDVGRTVADRARRRSSPGSSAGCSDRGYRGGRGRSSCSAPSPASSA